jgi:hypothetical protein
MEAAWGPALASSTILVVVKGLKAFPHIFQNTLTKEKKKDMFQELYDKQQPQETRLLQSLPGDTPQRCDSIFSFRGKFIQTLIALITPDLIIADIRTS